MCDFHNDLPLLPNGEDQFVLDTPVMRRFIAAVDEARTTPTWDEVRESVRRMAAV